MKKKLTFLILWTSYSAFTYYTGFKEAVNINLWVVPYGKPIYENKVKELIDLKKDGTFRLDQKYFNYATGLTMTNDKFNNYLDKTS